MPDKGNTEEVEFNAACAGAADDMSILDGNQAFLRDPAKQLMRLNAAGKGVAARMYLAAVQEALAVGGDSTEAFVKGLVEHATWMI